MAAHVDQVAATPAESYSGHLLSLMLFTLPCFLGKVKRTSGQSSVCFQAGMSRDVQVPVSIPRQCIGSLNLCAKGSGLVQNVLKLQAADAQ